MVNVRKGGGGVHPPPLPARANFTLMMYARKQPLPLCVLYSVVGVVGHGWGGGSFSGWRGGIFV
jgi:hypothetical protein